MTRGQVRTLLALGLLLGAGGSWAAAAAPALIAGPSEIGFVSRQMGVPVSGTFRNFDADVQFDPASPQKGHFRIGVDLASVALPTSDATREVVKPDWFDATRFPRAQFESTAVRSAGPAHYEIAGRLSIKGRARDVVVPVALSRSGDLTLASGELVVHRLDFLIGDGEWSDTSVVADDVRITFRLAFKGIGAI